MIPRICHNSSEESEICGVFESGSDTNIIGQSTSNHCIYSLLTEKIFQWSPARERSSFMEGRIFGLIPIIHNDNFIAIVSNHSLLLSLIILECRVGIYMDLLALADEMSVLNRCMMMLGIKDQTLTTWTSGSRLAPHDPCTQWVGYNTCNRHLGIDQILNEKNENQAEAK